MTVYCYNTHNINYIYKKWSEGRFPSHILYGACELHHEGIDVVLHRYTSPKLPRWRRMLDVAWQILTCRKHIDAVYGTTQNGLDLIILLRALGIFRKPVIIWHHQPILHKHSFLKRTIARLYFRGIDHMFMFSDNIVNVSAQTGLAPSTKLQQCPWGADLDFYDCLMKANDVQHEGFISTGKERRDMPTLLAAFQNCTDQNLQIIVPASNGDINYEKMLNVISIPSNVEVIVNRTMWLKELAELIWKRKAICICCQETNYTVGLTTLVEALAFGLPVIISKNPNQPFDASEEGCGITVEYGDVEGWQKAIRFIADNPDKAAEMGRRAREMAETTYNIRNCTKLVANQIRTIISQQ